jgi:hypothetical protein
MSDLNALVQAAESQPEDEATLAALADALGEASGHERLELVRQWVRARVAAASADLQLAQVREQARGRIDHNPNTRIFTIERQLSEHLSATAKEIGYLDESARRTMGDTLLRGIDLDRIYAIRLVRSQEELHSPYGLPRPRRLIRHILRVLPLDGGQVNLPEGA